MPDNWVIKLPQVDLPDQPILVHVTRKLNQELDLDLLATDGDAAYRGKVRERNHTKLKASNFDGTDAQWTAILRYVLVSKQNPGIDDAQRANLEVECSISGRDDKSPLFITFRSRIENITHRLGSIELAFSDETDDVDLFGWACQAIERYDESEREVATGKQQAQSAQSMIQSLQKQMDDMVKAKEEHESQLLSKFALLLDEKKLKIRNQQRILRAIQVDPAKLDQLKLTIDGDQTQASNKKRRRDLTNDDTDAGDDESDGFEAMEIDKTSSHQDDTASDSSDKGQTPEEVGAASEEDEHHAEPKAEKSTSVNRSRSLREPSPLPPPRILPFQKKSITASRPQASTTTTSKSVDINYDDETASEDDEL